MLGVVDVAHVLVAGVCGAGGGTLAVVAAGMDVCGSQRTVQRTFGADEASGGREEQGDIRDLPDTEMADSAGCMGCARYWGAGMRPRWQRRWRVRFVNA